MQNKAKVVRVGMSLNLSNPLHRQAWEILTRIPRRQRTSQICMAICQQTDRAQYLLDMKALIQKELQQRNYANPIPQPQTAGTVEANVLDYLCFLQEEGEEG
jgi:hypothetical protein